MSQALIVVDMLVGFLEQGRPLDCGDSARAIIPFVVKKARDFAARNEPIFFVADNHAPDDGEFDMFPPHCVAGTRESEVIPELERFVQQERLIHKTRFSGFFGTQLDELLQNVQPKVVEVVGVCTNICVLYTVEELRNRDYKTVVHRNGVASFDDAAHKFALAQMETVLGAEVR